MKILEILMLAMIVIAAILFFIPREKRPRIVFYLPALAVLLMILHFFVDGFRWQLATAYAADLVIFLLTLPTLLQVIKTGMPAKARRRWPGILGAIGALLLLVYTGVMNILFPMFSLPEPSGPYAVGTTYLYFVDTSRDDIFTDDPGDFREISIQVWYPAKISRKKPPIKYIPREAAVAFAETFSLPGYMMTHLALIPTHAYLDINLDTDKGPYPVVLFSHSGLMTGCQALAEEMASQGYVFMAIGHPHWNPFTFDDDGGVIPGDPDNAYLKLIWDELKAPVAENIKSGITQSFDLETKRELQKQLNDVYPIDIGDVRAWARDIAFVIECLDTLNQENRYFNKWLDLERIGVMGFSKGGCAAGQFCVTDDRCRAGINMDGFMYGDIVTTPLQKPFMFMHGETYIDSAFINDFFFYESESEAYMMKIAGSRHPNFGDLSLFDGVLQMSGTLGSIDGRRCIDIQNRYVLAFFDRYLKNMPSILLDGQSDVYPEVDFRYRRGGLSSE